jgi:hydroxypyruvate reductase
MNSKSSNAFLLKLFKFGVSNVQPRNILSNFIKADKKDIVVLDGRKKQLYKDFKRIIPICVGKASVDMGSTIMSILENCKEKLSEGVIVVNEENYKNISGFKCFKSGHPIPNKDGLLAAKFIEEKLRKLDEKDLVLLFLSGGGSALLPYPEGKIKLKEKIQINHLLLNSGANIKEINSVRKHLSKIKGGNFLKMSFPAKVHTFILSDVVGDDLSSISSGLTVPDKTTFSEVESILKKYNLWDLLSSSIKSHIEQGKKDKKMETPDRNSTLFKKVKNTLIGSNYLCLKSIDEYCKSKNINAHIWNSDFEGDVEDLADKFLKYLENIDHSKPVILISGGETTVKIRGKGKGGRNQEFALHFARKAYEYFPKLKYSLLSAGTDGRDGPTDAAGAIINEESMKSIELNKINLEKELNNNNSYEVLKKINSLVIINGTNTNVADIQLLMIR